MLDGSGLSVANYSATLIGWASQSPNALILGADGLFYDNAAVSDRDVLINTFGWNIVGDALAPPPPPPPPPTSSTTTSTTSPPSTVVPDEPVSPRFTG